MFLASRFPECQLENRQQQRYERVKEHITELLNCLYQENIQNMLNIKNGNPDRYKERANKYKETYSQRIKTVLSDN